MFLSKIFDENESIDLNDRALNFLVHKGACFFSRIAPHQQRAAVTTICCAHLSIKGKHCSGSAAAIKMHLQWEICIGRRIYTGENGEKVGRRKAVGHLAVLFT
jgi:hypothetical protein